MQENAASNYQLLTQLFKNDEAKFEDYNDATIAYYKAQEETLGAASNVQLAIISLEELIGVDFEEAKRLFGQL